MRPLRQNGVVITLTEPQVWVLIGVFAAAIFGMIGMVTSSFNRNLTTSLNALRETMDARFDALRSEIRGELAALNAKLDSLDRDVQALTRHVFGTDPRS